MNVQNLFGLFLRASPADERNGSAMVRGYAATLEAKIAGRKGRAFPLIGRHSREEYDKFNTYIRS